MAIWQLLIVLFAAVLHASWNIASKFGAGAGYFFAFAFSLFSFFFYLPWVIYILMTEDINPNFEVIFILALTAIVHLFYGLALLKGYQKANLSVVYPVSRGSGPLITSFVALGLFSETLNAWELLGIFSLCVGVLLIAAKEKLSDLFGRSESWVGVRWGVFIGTIIASYSIIDAYAVKTLALPPVLVGWVSSLGGTVLLLPKVLKNTAALRTQMRGIWPYACFVGFFSPLTYILVLYVLSQGAPVSIVAPLRESSMVFGALAGVWLFKERVSTLGWVGCALIFTGIFLVAT
ncbi:MAG TPA: DMT family transporter [Paenalcaligenes sp.]|nr:DMT family transporter [Paenalcaligenes sp.]